MDSDTHKCGIHYYAGMESYDMPSPALHAAFCDWVRGELAREFPDHNIVVIDDLVIARIVNIPGQGLLSNGSLTTTLTMSRFTNSAQPCCLAG